LKNRITISGVFLLLLNFLTTVQLASAQSDVHERLSLDNGWRFNMGDIPFPVIKGHNLTYANAKAGRAWGAAAPDYDDTIGLWNSRSIQQLTFRRVIASGVSAGTGVILKCLHQIAASTWSCNLMA
jgi:hypothetical protein